MRAKATKSAARFFQGVLARAFDTWRESTVEAKMLWEIASAALGRLRNRIVCSAFLRWLEKVEMTRAARRAAVFFVSRQSAAAFNTWRDVTEASREHHRALVVAQRALGKLLNRVLAGAFTRVRGHCDVFF